MDVITKPKLYHSVIIPGSILAWVHFFYSNDSGSLFVAAILTPIAISILYIRFVMKVKPEKEQRKIKESI
jgi:hypothetical protein